MTILESTCPEPRPIPYLWVTSVTKHLNGENNCKFAPWFKAHFKYTKEHSGFDQMQWQLEPHRATATTQVPFGIGRPYRFH